MLPACSSTRCIPPVLGRVGCAVVLAFVGVNGTIAPAADHAVSGIVEKEIARRNARIQEARTLITEGAILEAKGEYEQAANTYHQAWDLLPDAPMTAPIRLEARDGYSRAAV